MIKTNAIVDNRLAPGSDQPRMGKTFPERLDAAEARIQELEELVEHWQTMWEIADREVERLSKKIEDDSWQK